MNKDEFLDDLRKYLAILEDREQEDILEEYSQHIDMKISAGLSEAEAIGDFGSVKELAEQILEAYHVKPGYQERKRDRMRPDMAKAAQGGRKAWGSLGGFIGTLTRGIKHFGGVCWVKGKAAVIKTGRVLCMPFRRLWKLIRRNDSDASPAEYYLEGPEGLVMDAAGDEFQESKRTDRRIHGQAPAAGCRKVSGHRMAGGLGIAGFFAALTGLFCRCIRGVLSFCLWCVKWAWNCTMVIISFFSGLLTLFLLFTFAVLLVWLLKGYPLGGMTLACLGGVLCSGAFTMLCLTFLILRRKVIPETAPNVEIKREETDYA